MHRSIFLLLFSICGSALLAQVNLTTDYQPLQSRGPIPKNILSDAYQKADREATETGRNRRTQRAYSASVNYALDQLLRSPYVLFNTEANALCDALLDQLLADNPRLRKRLTVYLVRSSAVNAFSTDRGDIFINIGLLDRLRDRDELAFVLAHELIHSRERHAMQNFDFRVAGGDNFADAETSTEGLLREAQFSRELETEADLEGLDLYLRAGFDPGAPARVLELLDRAEIFPDRWTFDAEQLAELGLSANVAPDTASSMVDNDVQFETGFDEPEDVPVDSTDVAATDSLQVEKTAGNESFGSHPATEERLAAIRARTGALDTTTVAGVDSSFLVLRERMHFELLETFVLEGLYPAALYQALWLRERYPQNAWVEESLLYALYGMGQRASRDDALLFADYDTGAFGSMMQYLRRTDATERALASVATLHQRTHAQNEDTPDGLLPLLYRDATEDLIYHNRFDPEAFRATLPDSLQRYAPQQAAFRVMLRDATFQEHLERGKTFRDRDPGNMDAAQRRDFYAKRRDRAQRRLERGYALGQRRLVVVEPRHYSLNRRGGLELERSERNENKLRKNLREVSKQHPLDTKVLDARANMRKDAIEEYNDSRLLTQWMGQLGQRGFQIPRNHLRVLDVQRRRDDAVFMFLVTVRQHTNYPNWLDIPMFSWTLLAPPTLGFVLPVRNLMSRGNRAFILVMDPADITSLMRQEYRQRMMGSNAAQRQTLYWIFEQINQQP